MLKSKICSMCKKEKSSDNYYPTKVGKYKMMSKCKDCCKIYGRSYRRIGGSKNHQLKTKYRITLDQYFLILKNQNSVCAICKKSEVNKDKNGQIRALSVDHCHKTGKIRGLLCGNCNRAIGLLKESPENFKQALEYLK